VNLSDAIQRFRSIDEATTSSMLGLTTSNTGFPFYGMRGLAQVEKDRKTRMRKQKKCKGYDPKCRDAEWEVPARTGGVSLLRRSKLGER
jgi:hypothetical protein